VNPTARIVAHAPCITSETLDYISEIIIKRDFRESKESSITQLGCQNTDIPESTFTNHNIYKIKSVPHIMDKALPLVLDRACGLPQITFLISTMAYDKNKDEKGGFYPLRDLLHAITVKGGRYHHERHKRSC
jgi:hypothetical protein